jgi:parallel beta helix pectate lyase-like protein
MPVTARYATRASSVAFALALAAVPAARADTLQVGPQHALKTPSAAAAVAREGDIVEIEPGLYAGDAAVWTQNRLTIRARSGRAHLRADGAQAEGKGIWVVKGDGTTIENVEFSGAKVPDRNGAAIRLEGAGLAVRNCHFHDNENGILTGANLESDVLIEHSEFDHNGAGDGGSHNLYIGTVRIFTLRYSYSHHAIVGHNVKSRAIKNYILYNRIADEQDGRASYAIDLPDGGLSFVIGNVIQQGPENDNRTIVAYGAEGYRNLLNELYFASNTVVNDDPKGGRFVVIRPGADAVRVINNLFAGPGELVTGKADSRGNLRAATADFVNPDKLDYRPKPRAAAIGKGIDAGSAYGFSLRPSAEYRHPLGMAARASSAPLDLGALQHTP